MWRQDKYFFFQFYIMSASSKHDFSYFKLAYFENSMTTCDKLNYLININKIFVWLSFPFMEADFSTIAQVYAHSCSIYGVFIIFMIFFSISLIKLNTINKIRIKILDLWGKFYILNDFSLHDRWALPMCFHDVIVRWSFAIMLHKTSHKK